MIPLYTEEEYQNAKSIDKLKCECEECHKVFLKEKKHLKTAIKYNKKNKNSFCSNECVHHNKRRKKLLECKECNRDFLILPSQLKKYENHFCSHSCKATY